MSNKIIIHSDGSCWNTNKDVSGAREGGFGVVFRCGDKKLDYHSWCYTNTTSARMEWFGVLYAIKLLSTNPKYTIKIYCDNQYVVNTCNHDAWLWEKKGIIDTYKNPDLVKKFLKLMRKFPEQGKNIEFIWNKGHIGIELNELADELARKARKYHKKIQDLRK